MLNATGRTGQPLLVKRMYRDCTSPRPTTTRPVKVLIVEDEFILALNLQETLKSLGYVVTGMTTSAIETLCQVKQDRPDVVLMDIHLHGSQDGIETATCLWSRFRLPVVYVTSHSDPATLERAAATVSFGYLVKPVKATDLVTAIHVAYVCGQDNQS